MIKVSFLNLKNFTFRYWKIFLLVSLPISIVLIYFSVFPVKYFFICEGNVNKKTIDILTSENREKLSYHVDDEIIVVRKYFFGLLYSLNNYSVFSCSHLFNNTTIDCEISYQDLPRQYEESFNTYLSEFYRSSIHLHSDNLKTSYSEFLKCSKKDSVLN